MQLSIIIVNWNTKQYLKKSLESIFRTVQKNKITFEVIVVDNNSPDESAKMVAQKFPQVHLIASKINLGFGGGNNEGAKKAKGDYLLFLNPDTLVLNQALSEIIAYLERNSKVAILTPKLLLGDQKTVQNGLINYRPSLWRMIFEKPFKLLRPLVLKISLLRKLGQKITLDLWDFNQEREVDWVTGAALVIRKSLFQKLQGFDEKIFMYFEDVDLCLRAKKLGSRIVYYPDAEIIHFGGKSLELNRERKKIYYQSQDYFWSKYYSLFLLFLMKLIRFPYRVINYFLAK